MNHSAFFDDSPAMSSPPLRGHGSPSEHLAHNQKAASALVFQILGFSFWIFVVFCCCFNILAGRWIPSSRRRNNGNTERKLRTPSLGERLVRMPLADRQRYYSNLFDKHGNEIKLTANDIIVGTNCAGKEPENEGERESGMTGVTDTEIFNDEEDFCSIRVSLDSNNNNNNNNNSSSSSSDINADMVKKTKITINHRECIICFENFKVGDTIVHNGSWCHEPIIETTEDAPQILCLHIFHKDCMVEYLANRTLSAGGLRDGEGDRPACPTCRQTYCELLPIRNVFDDGKNENLIPTNNIDSEEVSSNDDVDVVIDRNTVNENRNNGDDANCNSSSVTNHNRATGGGNDIESQGTA
mmetsp:Transcript_20997/g.45756  ORF Transcript_20997/g.45756 Transcript_20997/m.45756 type:complete len:355 (+) Transcript_20997:124-1188(+)